MTVNLPPVPLGSINKHVALAHAYINAVQALDMDALAKVISPSVTVQFLPSASIGPLGEKVLDHAGLLGVGAMLKSLLKDSRLPMEIIEVVDASPVNIVILHTKAKGAFTTDGRPFTNEYNVTLWMEEVDGELKVVRSQEFVDSAFVQSIFTPVA